MKLFNPIILLLVLLATGCAKHLESINVNPNSPDHVSNPGLLLTNVIRGAANTHFDRSFDRGSVANMPCPRATGIRSSAPAEPASPSAARTCAMRVRICSSSSCHCAVRLLSSSTSRTAAAP